MKENFNVRDKKGSIALFVLVGLLFMSGFLIILYGYNVNKSKIAKEQFNSISDIYSHKDGNVNAYDRAYTALRKKNKQTLTKTIEDSSVLELDRTYEENLVNYRIYGKGTTLEGYKMDITNLTKEGFLPLSGAYPNANSTYPNAKYEIIEIKQGQTFNLNFSATETSGNYGLRIRCIDSDTNEIVCDLVNDNGEQEEKGKDYFETTIYYSFTKKANGYITAKKDFKIGIMYIVNVPDDFKLELESTIQAKLPEEYKQVEYIKSTGTQYIDTGYVPNSNTTIEMKASNSSTGNATLYCARTAVNNKTYTAFLMGGNRLRVDYNNNNTSYQDIMTVNQDTAYVYKQDKNMMYVNGNLIKELADEEFSAEYNMYLMASHFLGTGISNIGNVKLYYCRIWDNGIIVRDFIPCYKNENGIDIPGLYDTIEGIFYTSEATTAFEKGNDISRLGDLITDIADENYGKYKIPIQITNAEEESITEDIILNEQLGANEYIDYKSQKIIRTNGVEENVELPEILAYEDYTEIEITTNLAPSKIEVEYITYKVNEYSTLKYIETTGTQYIDTGYIPNSNTSIEMKVSNSATTNANLYCARGTNASDSTYTAFLIYGTKLRVDYYNKQYDDLMQMDKDTVCVYKQEKNNVYVDGTLVKTLDESEFASQYNMYLMASHLAGGYVENIGNVKLYYCKIWDNGTLVREFVPSRRNEDGKIGLYDKVNNKFYINPGTGEFVAGPEV